MTPSLSRIAFTASALAAASAWGLPNVNARDAFHEATRWCSKMARQGKAVDPETFENCVFYRAKAAKLDPTIATSSERIDNYQAVTYAQQARAFDDQIAAIRQRSAAALSSPALVVPRLDAALGDCLTRKPRGQGFGSGYAETDLMHFTDARARVDETYPGGEAFKSTAAHGSYPAGTTYGTLLDACQKSLGGELNGTRARETAEMERDRKKREEQAKRDLEEDKQWRAGVKGDRLKVLQAMGSVPGGQMQGAEWTWIRGNPPHGDCTFIYRFDADRLVTKHQSGHCEEMPFPF